MKLNGVEIEDTFAEAFSLSMARVVLTAISRRWAMVAAREATGFGTSVIGCPSEAGIDCLIPPDKTPDKRPGVAIIICHPQKDGLKTQLIGRIGECILTAPTAAAFNGLEKETEGTIPVKLHFFGDGFEHEEEVGGRKVWAIPMMEGDFICEEEYGFKKGVAGGNIFIFAKNQMAALTAAESAVDVIYDVEGAITPFPGGIVASGTKIGSKYSFLEASTNERFCPTLKDKIDDSQIPKDVEAVYEIVINGLDVEAVRKAMKTGISAATMIPGVVKIGAGNYGGKLGKYNIELHELLKI
jgi:formylmethanofuran--tetrahydromethanopterin N-formyltransferase